jgi:RNA-directed DNA polymerase
VSWILDPDLKSFFDNISHEKLVQLVEKRIADPRVLRLIQKWLKAGVMEDVWSETEAGTPQGAVVSPLLSNVYLHYVLDQWRQTARGRDYHRALRRRCHSFERQHEPESYLKELKERLREYGLELNEDKTRLIRFGRFARLNRAERREGKPETFTFLGFHHIWGNNRLGRFEVRISGSGGAPLVQDPCQRSQRRPTWKKLGPLFNHWFSTGSVACGAVLGYDKQSRCGLK